LSSNYTDNGVVNGPLVGMTGSFINYKKCTCTPV